LQRVGQGAIGRTEVNRVAVGLQGGRNGFNCFSGIKFCPGIMGGINMPGYVALEIRRQGNAP
jgi:hypothetical protein